MEKVSMPYYRCRIHRQKRVENCAYAKFGEILFVERAHDEVDTVPCFGAHVAIELMSLTRYACVHASFIP
jgi:hypothetical protein